MKNKARQFDSFQDIEVFVHNANNRVLDNIWENILDEWDGEEYIVEQFNIALENLAEVIS